MRLLAIAALTSLTSLVYAAAPVPRPAPDFAVISPAGNKKLSLSSLKGKVVVMEFLDTTCPHCQHALMILTMLQAQMGPKGFQAVGVAGYNNSPPQVFGFIQQFYPNFPVGISDNQSIIKFLGFSENDRVMVPQMAVIDRKGVIRAQSGPTPDKNLQDQDYLHDLIDRLLKEGAGPTPATKTTASPKKT